jgi:hypothetical protein
MTKKSEDTNSINRGEDLAAQLQQDIKEEIYKAIKYPRSRLLRSLLNPLVNLPTRHFAEIFAKLDSIVKNQGIIAAAQYGISLFSREVTSRGEEMIPAQGPLVIASNHPGTYDSLAIVSRIPREDVKVIVSGVPFLRNLPNAREHLIYATGDTMDRMEVIRKSIRHLEQGGTLLFFPSGKIDPDPSVLPGAHEGLHRWSRSLEVFLRKVPALNLVLTITSGVLAKDSIRHPLAHIFPDGHERRRVMEFMQVIRQMIRNQPADLYPRVTFAEPLPAREILDQPQDCLNSMVQARASRLLDYHINNFYPGVVS